ncbi:glypican-5b [Trichomycterus rosablanca]|uniref:glypican-5b n=1 Tax=Trichomycterus rosablanca TaxID=2290929 RepID=UPI002F3571F7
MLRETLLRVWICWMLSFVLLWGVKSAGAHSCHEVKTAFQLRQIGPLKWVPETAATGTELQICKHQGPTCCTRKMEESYHAAAHRDTLQSILSYNLELKYLILGHATEFQDTFHSLLSFTLNHTISLLDMAYKPIAHEARPLVSALFSDLALYLRGDDEVSVTQSVRHFYNELFLLVYRYLLNPGLASSPWSSEGAECLRATRQDLDPFGAHPRELARGLERVLGVGRSLMQALTVGVEVLNATESLGLAKDCGRALVRMQYCPHCRGLTLIRPCQGLCLHVMRGCLAGLAELQSHWRNYIALLEGTSAALAGGHELEITLLGIRERINDAILTAQLRGPQLSALVEKVCGPLTESTHESPTTNTTQSPTVSVQNSSVESVPSPSPTAENKTEEHHITRRKRSLPLKASKHDKPRSVRRISREFMGYIQGYKTFFLTLPESLCESELVGDEHTCWNGEDVVESNAGNGIGNDLQAQIENPEIKVRRMDPVLIEAKQRLEKFNQEMFAEMGLDVEPYKHVDVGSGYSPEISGDCDDEDGCEASGEDEVQPEIVRFSPSLEASTGVMNSSSLLLLFSLLFLLHHLLHTS